MRIDKITLAIWLTGLLAYGGFFAWYDNWRAPLNEREVEEFMQQMQTSGTTDEHILAQTRDFLLADDGGEFVMLNLLRFNDQAKHPDTGEAVAPRDLLGMYFEPFAASLFAKAGHPVFVAQVAGGYVEAWGVAEMPDWQTAGFIRYRSRRDMVELVGDPQFSNIHPYKIAALQRTVAFPIKPISPVLANPRIWVAMVLALLCSLATIIRLWSRDFSK